MDYKKILDKYWEGNTTLEEELLLKKYCQEENIAEEFKALRPYFEYAKIQKQQKLEKPISELLEPVLTKTPTIKRRFLFRRYWQVAAAVLLLFFVGANLLKTNTLSKEEKIANYWASKEIKDPQQAYVKTKAALLLVSTKLNKGTNAALNQVSKMKKVKQYVRY